MCASLTPIGEMIVLLDGMAYSKLGFIGVNGAKYLFDVVNIFRCPVKQYFVI